MGRAEVRHAARKKAAKSCHKLESFFVPHEGKQQHVHGDTETPTALEERREENDSSQSPPSKRQCVELIQESSESVEDKGVRDLETTMADNTKNTDTSSSGTQYDIGKTINATMTVDEIEKAISDMSDGVKYALSTNHDQPCHDYVFPTTEMRGFQRSFQYSWLKLYPWIVYSIKLDGAFCLPCALFATDRKNKGTFVNAPFTNWCKFNKKATNHQTSNYHTDAVRDMDCFIGGVAHPEQNIASRMDKQRVERISENREILKCIIEAVLFCGKQCIALRGDKEDLNSPGNPGNFLSLLKLMSNHNQSLKKHIDSPRLKCATYRSAKTQNELLDIISQDIITSDLVSEIKAARYFSLIADEVSSHNTEQLALCIRFVDTFDNIREEFICFSRVERTTGAYLAAEIKNVLDTIGLDIANVRGQGYDGAANMSSANIGVQAKIKEDAPKAAYVHCNGHCLNLVIGSSCSIPDIQHALDRLKCICLFFMGSPKRNETLEELVSIHSTDRSKRKAILDLCRTRWAARHTAYQHFYQSYVYIVEALELIGHGTYDEENDECVSWAAKFSDWQPKTKMEAQQFLKSITSFDFIVVFLVVYQLLSHLSGITVLLQSKTLDIIAAHGMINDIKAVYSSLREDVENTFSSIYQQAVILAEKVGTSPEKPRTTGRQRHRANNPSVDIEGHYRLNIVIPFLDHIISNLDARFDMMTVTATSLLCLVPSIICEQDASVNDAAELYRDDLPSPELLSQEIVRWKSKFLQVPATDRPNTPAAAIKVCDGRIYPNVRVLLQIACTLPVTSCECERSASALRRLHTYTRASMNQDRLTNLALVHIHYDKTFDKDRIVDLYAAKHTRRMELESLI